MNDRALANAALANSMAAMDLLGDLLAYLAKRDEEAFKRWADERIEQCETLIANGPRPGFDPEREDLFLGVTHARLGALRNAI